MNAQEARELAQKQLKGPAIEHLLGIVDKQVRAAANEGKMSIADPLRGIRTPITCLQERAVYAVLVEQGYKVSRNGGEDPGDPRDSPYLEISWRE